MGSKKQKTGGRAAGTPNKRTLEAIEVFGEYDFCPLEKLLERLKSPGISDELFTSTCLKLLDFKFPKRKAVEHSFGMLDRPVEELIAEAKHIIQNFEKGLENGL